MLCGTLSAGHTCSVISYLMVCQLASLCGSFQTASHVKSHSVSLTVYVFCTHNPCKTMQWTAQGFVLLFMYATEYIDMGWDGPAGNMYVSTSDLAQLMMMLFRDNQTYNPSTGQVTTSLSSCHVAFPSSSLSFKQPHI